MIEIRTFADGPEELSAFCMQVWQERYTGKMPFAFWSGPFLDWELFPDPARPDSTTDRGLIVAAYDSGRLVGVLPAKPVDLQWRGEALRGSISSFFSVDPQYEQQGVSLKLLLEQRRRHRARDLKVFLGYAIIGAKASMGKEFWFRLPGTSVISKVGLWARVIDHQALDEFLFAARDRWGVKLLRLFQGRPRAPKDMRGIRPFEQRDLADCLRLANQASAEAEFGFVWNEASLGRQLSFQGFPRTIVAEEQGRVAGFINYFHFKLLGRRNSIKVAVIDFIPTGELSSPGRNRLLQASLARMADEGCQMVLHPRSATDRKGPLLRAGFAPQLPEYSYIAHAMAPSIPEIKTPRLHVTWR